MRSIGGISQSNNCVICFLWPSVTPFGKVSIQDKKTGRQPSSTGCTYTIPHLLTVAGEATAKSWTSKIMFINPCIAIISPAC